MLGAQQQQPKESNCPPGPKAGMRQGLALGPRIWGFLCPKFVGRRALLLGPHTQPTGQGEAWPSREMHTFCFSSMLPT